jgi:spore coat protein A, manganese oxidase
MSLTPNLGRSGRAALAFALALVAACVTTGASFAQLPLNPLTLTKYMDPLPIPGPMPMAGPNYYEIGAYQVTQQLHSQLPPTTVWGYGTSQANASYPAATIEAQCGVPLDIKWTNHLPQEHLLGYAIDYTLHMAGYHMGEPTGEWTAGVPIVTHVHGAEVEPQSDGGPNGWFTQDYTQRGSSWSKETYHYANDQLPATIWYHDHVLGLTRLNVYAGLAGYYLLRDPAIEAPLNLPSGAYEVPLAIQDKMFFDNGQLLYPVGGDNPAIHPIWQPEFFGNVIMVNGKVWPYLNVEPRKYRFRMLNGSNARFYAMQMVDNATGMPGPGFWQIGSDGGYLDTPVLIADPNNPAATRLVMAPGERCDVIVDFSGYAPGTVFTLKNNAKSPYPNGAVVDPQTTGQIMQFRVVPLTAPDNSSIRTPGPGYVEKLQPANATVTRTMTLDEMMGPNGPVMAMLNNSMWDDPVTEIPAVGSTEIWRIVNTTGDAHPIHLHLVQFQLLSRQKYQVSKYMRAYMMGGPAPDPTRYLTGKAQPAPPEEAGWKDTFKMYPGEVTTVIVRFAPQRSSVSQFAFDATAEPGYVWHCHIIEHEDNEMMRPYKLQAPLAPQFANAPALEEAPIVPVEDATALRFGPNPVNGRADVQFRLTQAGQGSLRVYGVDGRLVKIVAEGEFSAGLHNASWGSDDERGLRVPSGIYFLRLESKGVNSTRRVVVAR